MIQFEELKEELLLKATKVRKFNGQYIWVKVPVKKEDGGMGMGLRRKKVKNVKDTDIAQNNQHLLSDEHQQASVKARYTAKQQKSEGEKKERKKRAALISNEGKEKARKFSAKFGSNEEFLTHIESLGITWKKNDHPGINIMYAKQELGKAIDKGWDPEKGEKYVPEENTADNVSESNETVSTPDTNSSTANSDKDATKTDAKAGAKPAKGKNHSGNMHSYISQESKDKADEFYQQTCGKDRPTFYSKLKEIGITWNENKDDRVNFLNAKRALQHHIEYPDEHDVQLPEGLSKTSSKPAGDITAGDAAAGDTAAATSTEKQSSEQEKTATESVAQNKTETPKETSFKDESLLEIPEGATEREIALINLINSMNDVDDMESCARVGMVPEDERSKSFIVDELQVRLAAAVLNPKESTWLNDKDSKGNIQFPPDIRDAIIKEWGMKKIKELANRLPELQAGEAAFDKNPAGFGEAMSKQLAIVGCKKSCISAGFEQIANFNMNYLINPRDELSPKTQTDFAGKKFADIFKSLNEGYSDYTTSKYKTQYLTNLGYTGHDPDEYTARYNVQKEGVYKALKQIGKNNPALKDQVNMMCLTYDDMMQQVGGNPYALEMVLKTPEFNQKPSDSVALSKFGKERYESLPEIHRAIQTTDKLSDFVISQLTSRGYSQQNILEALSNTDTNDLLTSFDIRNAKGEIETIDLTATIDKDGDAWPIEDERGHAIVRTNRGEQNWGKGLLMYTQAKYRQSQNLPIDGTPQAEEMKKSLDFYKEMKTVASISEDTYKQVHELATGFFGMNYVDKNGHLLDWSNTEVDQDWSYGSKVVASDKSPEVDIVLSNLLMSKLTHDMNSAIAAKVNRNTSGSFNDNGSNYGKNFDYYSGSVMANANDSERYTQLGNSGENAAVYTAKQLSAKITSQLSSVPNYPIEYIDKLKAYYMTTGKKPRNDSLRTGWGYGASVFNNSPIKDVVYNMSRNVSEHTPEEASKPSFNKLTAKRLNYVPFDFSKRAQPTLKKPAKVKKAPPTPEQLKRARQKLQEKANCSVKTLSKHATKEMWLQMVANDMDYKTGEKTRFGTSMEPRYTLQDPKQSYDETNETYNRKLLLNSPIFKINNSVIQERFQQRQEQMKAAGKKPECYDPIKVFNGTSTWAAANLLGREGAFRANEEYKRSGNQVLGAGPYGALKMGLAADYVGDAPYANRHKDVSNNRADGIMCVMSGMPGEKSVPYSKTPSKFATSMYVDATPPRDYRQYKSGSRDAQICFKDPDLVSVDYIFSVSSRVMGTNVHEGTYGYRDTTGTTTHDKNGISLDIRYN